jgi:hypothetical protein
VIKPLLYPLIREWHRWRDRWQSRSLRTYNAKLREHKPAHTHEKKVFVHGRGYEWFATSTLKAHYDYELVDRPQEAQLIVFINTIENHAPLTGKTIYLFFSEPSAYRHLYNNDLPEEFFERNQVTVISHFPDPSSIIASGKFRYLRAFSYYHNHHGASPQILFGLDPQKRTKQVFAISSGLKGIAGNEARKHFITTLARSNPQFDFYGRFSREAYAMPNYRGPWTLKWQLLERYRYNLVIENSPQEDWYISEKIYDALLCGCMPIYHGTYKILEVLPKEWFYYLPSLETHEIEKLNAFLKTDTYKKVANHRNEITHFIDEHFSIYRAIDDLVHDRPLRNLIQ